MIEVVPDYSAYTGSRTNQVPTLPPKKHTIRTVIIAILAVSIAAIITVFVLNRMQYAQSVDAVKNTLISQNKIMQASVKEGVYAATVPSQIVSTKEVEITPTVSADGKSYCISGKSLKNETIVFSIGSHTPADAPKEGDCTSRDNATVPTKPALPSVGSVTAESIHLIWDASAFAASYNLRCSTSKNFTENVVTSESKTNSGAVSKLKNGSVYFCAVQAVNDTGVSIWSDTVTVQTVLVSTAPGNLKITPVSSSEIKYEWSAVQGATSYELEYSSDVNFVKDVNKVSLNSTSGSITGLKADTMYYMHVRAFTDQFDAGSAAFSGVLEEKTLK